MGPEPEDRQMPRSHTSTELKRSLELVHPTRVEEPVDTYFEAARGAFSRNTERALRSDVHVFRTWCREQVRTAFPASAATVAAFIDEMGRIKTPATVRRYTSKHRDRAQGAPGDQPARQRGRAVRAATDAPPTRTPPSASPGTDVAAAQPADRSNRRPADRRAGPRAAGRRLRHAAAASRACSGQSAGSTGGNGRDRNGTRALREDGRGGTRRDALLGARHRAARQGRGSTSAG